MALKDLTCKAGDSKDYLCTFTDSAGNVINITGWTVYFTVKGSTVLISSDVSVHTDPTHGITTVSLAAVQTQIAAGMYDYEIRAKTNDVPAKVMTILTAKFTVSLPLRAVA